MKAKIKFEKEIDLNEIIIDGKSINEILNVVHKNCLTVLKDLSIHKQNNEPLDEDFDTPIHQILNLIEKIKS